MHTHVQHSRAMRRHGHSSTEAHTVACALLKSSPGPSSPQTARTAASGGRLPPPAGGALVGQPRAALLLAGTRLSPAAPDCDPHMSSPTPVLRCPGAAPRPGPSGRVGSRPGAPAQFRVAADRTACPPPRAPEPGSEASIPGWVLAPGPPRCAAGPRPAADSLAFPCLPLFSLPAAASTGRAALPDRRKYQPRSGPGRFKL